MPVVVYRQPWFWAVIIAVAAVLGFVIIIAASGPNRDERDSTTIIQQPSPEPAPQVTPTPAPSVGVAEPTQPAEPVQPERPVAPAQPAQPQRPQVIREREKTVIIREGSGSQNSGAAPHGATSGAGATFLNTGLPKEISFDDADWRAAGTQTMPADQLKSVGTTPDGTELFVSVNAQEPYQSVLALVPTETDKYVRYELRR